jgi:hypothetical protein
MQELTTYEIDAELAEQLPARELMNVWYPSKSGSSVHQTNVASQGDTAQFGALNINASNDQVNLASFGNQNGGIYQFNGA